ncbi:hypothetical protein SERLADRAFT_471018 [Serpula lacrymans var. lacrymans S7.9]|uniref:Uncharacterized protein n=1 Tax=Serpula lacrymans var. lacrymans (strain S7.9) TaxID=578457 RepID=F8P0L5_SERL9|nr:uncharacterized protein SERLADRAFT_471018 [Serpula lacrymans var. lacrymans S7.9]EGO22699.1 hypothetical protein SERLADRAFT_471018 [Serpula lacrymans var. lacrymans S7.9]
MILQGLGGNVISGEVSDLLKPASRDFKREDTASTSVPRVGNRACAELLFLHDTV